MHWEYYVIVTSTANCAVLSLVDDNGYCTEGYVAFGWQSIGVLAAIDHHNYGIVNAAKSAMPMITRSTPIEAIIASNIGATAAFEYIEQRQRRHDRIRRGIVKSNVHKSIVRKASRRLRDV